MTPIMCGFRHDVIQTDRGETARCELLKRIIADTSGCASRVDRSACQYCFGNGRVDPRRISQVLGSAILSAGLNPTARSAYDARLKQLADFAIAEPAPHANPQPTAAIDVVLPVQFADPATAQCIEAWLRQYDVFVVLHLVVVAVESPADWQRYQDNPNIRIHHFKSLKIRDQTVSFSGDAVTMALCAAQAITDQLETPFLAFGCVDVLPSPTHLAQATLAMTQGAIEWYAASIQDGGRILGSSHPDQRMWRRSVQTETAVLRRALWVDLNGMAARTAGADVEFFDRAARQRRSGIVSQQVVATTATRRTLAPKGDPPPRFGSPHDADLFELHHQGIGFASERLACDVVLPFCGQLNYVQQAIDSILSQTDIELRLHLIDDATPQDIDSWLRRQLDDERVRIYRNATNIGQFLSFNNVAEFFATDWIVTQDGDDVSLPGRLADTVGFAQRCDADLAGAATVLDGPEDQVISMRQMTTVQGGNKRHHRLSYPPHPNLNTYFLENPTLVHRRSFFERLGGFADFADPLRNRTTLDTEYMLRALYAGANIVSSRRLAVRYRVHPQSAVHHEETRMGSPIRNWAQKELTRRLQLFRRGGIDPRVFGSLGRHRGITRCWNG